MQAKALGVTLLIVLAFFAAPFVAVPTMASSATSSIHVIKYDADSNVAAETTKTYQWLKDNLPNQGDGVTHYYHQGPIFEGDPWDPSETQNLKDKGAVMGTAVKDLCELVGGMSSEYEVMLRAVDGWHTEFAYENIYQPRTEQGVITLCWYCGEDAESGEQYGVGYPGDYYDAMQIVMITTTANVNGQHVFGNSDMKLCLPDEKYQHFYEGLPSTNGLSGKWINQVLIYTGEPPAIENSTVINDQNPHANPQYPIIPIAIGGAGAVIAAAALIMLRRKPK